VLKVGSTITVSDDNSSTIYKVLAVTSEKKKKSRLYRLEATEVDSDKPPYELLAWLPNAIVRSDNNEVHTNSNM
jgi:hypothetical protein